MATLLRVVLTVLFSILLQAHAWSQSGADVVGSADYPGISRFSGARIVDYREVGDTNYRLALGRLQRVNGRVMAGREERIQGALTRITYEIPPGYSGADVFARLSTQLLAEGGEELYRCQGRACGSSNFWANDIFANRVLYGPETDQFYLASTRAAEVESPGIYTALYVITRGNRTVLAHLDILALSGASHSEHLSAQVSTSEALLTRLQQDGVVVVPGLQFDGQDQLIDEGGLALLVETLLNNPQLSVYVVAHLRAEGSLDAQVERSRHRAALITTQLSEAGIAAERMSAQGVGPLAPACSTGSCIERVELVLQ
ncbi:MAG: DUF4892 domain-containing protein [Gammaproteobacteria bacterium]|nr:DUF4892 domain-containing protein [Gammaproteobacteria bacterium]